MDREDVLTECVSLCLSLLTNMLYREYVQAKDEETHQAIEELFQASERLKALRGKSEKGLVEENNRLKQEVELLKSKIERIHRDLQAFVDAMLYD